MEKGNIIAKLNIKDYSKLLEEILANKPFSENAKNILLEILYKIEAGYNDYKTVKVNVLPKKDIIEEIIDLISKCNKIEIYFNKYCFRLHALKASALPFG